MQYWLEFRIAYISEVLNSAIHSATSAEKNITSITSIIIHAGIM